MRDVCADVMIDLIDIYIIESPIIWQTKFLLLEQ